MKESQPRDMTMQEVHYHGQKKSQKFSGDENSARAFFDIYAPAKRNWLRDKLRAQNITDGSQSDTSDLTRDTSETIESMGPGYSAYEHLLWISGQSNEAFGVRETLPSSQLLQGSYGGRKVKVYRPEVKYGDDDGTLRMRRVSMVFGVVRGSEPASEASGEGEGTSEIVAGKSN